MTDINPSAAAAREASREATGQFGAQEHSAPEGEIAAPPRTEREQRLDSMVATRVELLRQLADADARLRTALVGELWEKVPVGVESIEVSQVWSDETSFLGFDGLRGADGEYIDEGTYDRGLYDDFTSFFTTDTIDDYFTRGEQRFADQVFALDVGKDATRARIGALQDEWRGNAFGRSSREIGDDIDTATTRLIRQVAAEQGFESIELVWDEPGRTGLRLSAVTAAGKRHKAGSGNLDDHEVLWAAGQYSSPQVGMRAPNGVVGPFIIDTSS